MRYPFESQEAQQLNRDIFETIYYSALKASCELAARFGPYETYAGSPVSQGVSLLFVSLSLLCLVHRVITHLEEPGNDKIVTVTEIGKHQEKL